MGTRILPGVPRTSEIAPRGKSHPGHLEVLSSKEPLSRPKKVWRVLPDPRGAGVTSKQTEAPQSSWPGAFGPEGKAAEGGDDFCQVSTWSGQLEPQASSERG